MKKIKWYFDFVSPYAYLQSAQLGDLVELAEIECIPILFAGLLDHWGQKGPAEIVPKKQFIFRQCLWRARKMGIPYNLPPKHPFNPLRALRLAVAIGAQVPTVQKIFRSIWVDGNLPDDDKGWLSIQNALGVMDANTLVADPKVKSILITNGESARLNGVFGVPTCLVGKEIFWGDDSLEMVVSYLKTPGMFEDKDMKSIDVLEETSRRQQKS